MSGRHVKCRVLSQGRCVSVDRTCALRSQEASLAVKDEKVHGKVDGCVPKENLGVCAF